MSELVVSATNLTKRFGDFTAVDEIDFEVRPGEAFGFLGPNGAGKSSTMRMIGAVSPISGGELTVLGMNPTTDGAAIRTRLGVVPQEDNLDQLEHRASSKVDALSGGMKRRLTIARALINRPDVMLLDEPTTGLDPQARHLLWDRLYRLKQEGVTLIITTHYMDEAEQLCDRLVVMDKGKIAAEGSPRELIERYSPREVVELRFAVGVQAEVIDQLRDAAIRLEELPDRVLLYTDDADATTAEVHRRGLEPETVVARRSSLEDVFLRLTGRTLVD